MQTWYAARCERHGESTAIFVRASYPLQSAAGQDIGWAPDNEVHAKEFLSKHFGCNLQLAHDDQAWVATPTVVVEALADLAHTERVADNMMREYEATLRGAGADTRACPALQEYYRLLGRR